VRPGSMYLVAAAAVLIVPAVALWTQAGHRLAFQDGDLVLVRYYWWGAREQIEGKLEGLRGRWWIAYPDGTTEPYGVEAGAFTVPAESAPAASQ